MPDKPVIHTTNPPALAAPVGYSQVVEARGGRTVYIAGQTASDQHGNLVGKGDFAAQADQVFRNIAAALAAVGCTAGDLVKLTVFVRDMQNLQAYRTSRQRFFATVTPPAAPAVTLVEITKLAAEDFLIEVEAVAVTAG